jgi:hypothetical protein
MRKKLGAGKDRKDCGCQEKSWWRRKRGSNPRDTADKTEVWNTIGRGHKS